MKKKIKFVGLMLSIITLLGLLGVTTPVSAATCTSFTMTGFVLPKGHTTTAWFEYGTSNSIVAGGQGIRTGIQTFTSNSNISQLVTGLSESTTYYFRLVASNSAGTTKFSINSFTTPSCQNNPAPNQPSVTLSADDYNINNGSSTTIRWNTSNNPTSCTGTGGANGWSGSKSTNGGGFDTGSLFSTTTYSINCSNNSGSDSDSVTVVVGGQQSQPNVTISADDTSIDEGDSTRIRWDSSNATDCYGSGGTNNWSGPKNLSGSFDTGWLDSDETYRITCTNDNGGSASDSVTVRVDDDSNNNDEPSVNISADDTSIDEDDSTTIRWDVEDADFCEGEDGDNGWDGRSLDEDGGSFRTGSLDRDTTFTIICGNDDGDTDEDSVTIRVDDDNDNDNDDLRVDISADDTSIDEGDSTRIRWDTEDADSCEGERGTNAWDGRNLDEDGGSFSTGKLYRDTTFQITCKDDDGNKDTDSVTIRVDDDNDNDNDNEAPTATTTVALQLSNNSAQLNSLIFTGSSDTDAWFEWGSSFGLSNRTITKTLGESATTRDTSIVTGLSTGVTYYFRAVAENPYGRSYGNTMSFFMQNLQNTPSTTVNRTTTVINRVDALSLVKLTIDGGSENIFPGENRDYYIEWENTSNQTLRKVVLRVILPRSIEFERANRGSFSEDDNTLTLDLDTLEPGEDGNIFLSGNASSLLRQGELVVVVANLVYTDQSNVQRDALAYATARGDLSGSVLGASAFGAGFLPNTLLGWIFFLILVLITVLLSKYLYGQFKTPRTVPVEH